MTPGRLRKELSSSEFLYLITKLRTEEEAQFEKEKWEYTRRHKWEYYAAQIAREICVSQLAGKDKSKIKLENFFFDYGKAGEDETHEVLRVRKKKKKKKIEAKDDPVVIAEKLQWFNRLGIPLKMDQLTRKKFNAPVSPESI